MGEHDVLITEDVRVAGRGVLDRLDSDDAFRERFLEDPVAVLTEAGIPDIVMPLLANAATSGSSEVEGFAAGMQGIGLKLHHIGLPYSGSNAGTCGPTNTCSDGDECVRGFWYS